MAGAERREPKERKIHAGADEFESRFMADEAEVVYRDKRVSRGMAGLLGGSGLALWALGAFIPFRNASLQHPAPAWALLFVLGLLAAFGLGMMALGVMFGVVRTLVTHRAVLVKYGLSGPSIALDSITSCRVVDYKWTRFGGFGVRIGLDGTRAYVPGPGETVELTYREGAEERKVQIGAGDAPALARAIQRARQARGGVRIAVDENDTAVQAEQEAMAEAEADAEAEAALEKEAKRESDARPGG